MIAIVEHALFDLLYGTGIACFVGRCQHRHHRAGFQVVASVVGAIVLVHVVG